MQDAAPLGRGDGIFLQQEPQVAVFGGVDGGDGGDFESVEGRVGFVAAQVVPQPPQAPFALSGVNDPAVEAKDQPALAVKLLVRLVFDRVRGRTVGFHHQFPGPLTQLDQLQYAADINFIQRALHEASGLPIIAGILSPPSSHTSPA